MKINAQVTIHFESQAGYSGLFIEVHDKDSSITFLRIGLDEQQATQALSRLAHTECTAEVYGLDRIGKIMECKKFEFPCGDLGWENKKEKAIEISKKYIPDGWISDNRFSSQDSFFKRDGESWARTTIRRWVDKEDSENV